jgi:multidrug efflux pump subunit AcrA (membrane-fusion protein)
MRRCARDANTGRIGREAEVEIADRRADIAGLQRQLADLEGQALAEEAEARAIQRRIDAHFIRAAIDGHLGRVEALRAGAVVRTGQVLGAVVPGGKPRAVAWFGSPAVGRIQPGQNARLRLDGFPWTQYGTLTATVDSVGSDPLGDRVRVELVLKPDAALSIPLGHGLSGTTEIEVERISPAHLMLRAVGRWLTTRRAAPTENGGTVAERPDAPPGK